MWFARTRRARKDPDVAIRLGMLRQQKGDLWRAASAYRLAAESDDPSAAAHAEFRLGVIWRNLGRHEWAEASLMKALVSGHAEFAPRAGYELGALLARDRTRAAIAYQAVIDSGHRELAAPARLRLGEIREHEHDDRAAAALYQETIDSGHGDAAPMALVLLGKLRMHQGEKEGAKALFERAKRSNHSEARAEAYRQLYPPRSKPKPASSRRPTAKGVAAGMTMARVREMLGEPHTQVRQKDMIRRYKRLVRIGLAPSADVEYWLYRLASGDGLSLRFVNGRVTDVRRHRG